MWKYEISKKTNSEWRVKLAGTQSCVRLAFWSGQEVNRSLLFAQTCLLSGRKLLMCCRTEGSPKGDFGSVYKKGVKVFMGV